MADPPRHVFSIDVEEWFQGIELPMSEWSGLERRIRTGMDELLDLMERHGVRATCFVLGWVAERYPEVVRELHDAGHEIATHGYTHRKIYDLSPDEFREEIRSSTALLEEITGQPVVGFRAPYFTITRQSLWALRVLAEEGILYDSSIHPVFNDRYGIPDAARLPSVVKLPEAEEMFEAPVSTFPVGGFNIPVGGGAYLRIWPGTVLEAALRRLETRGETLILYVHPWELDPDHPRIDLPWRVSATHYFNLGSTRPKLERLFGSFDFSTFKDVFGDRLGVGSE